MPTTSELAAITAARAAVVAGYRTRTASIRTQPSASDGYGGTTARGAVSTWTQRLTAACKVESAGQTPQVREIAERLGVQVLWEVRFAPGTDVRTGDGLIIDSVVYHVIAPLAGTHDSSLIVLCRRQEGDA